jgi:hypothetical protein
MSNRPLIGLLAAGFALALSDACSHQGGSGSTGTAGNTGAGNGSGQAGTGSGSAGTTGSAGTFGDTGTGGSAIGSTAGTTGSGGTVGSAGTNGGSAGTTGAGGAVSANEMIDNLDDNDRMIIAANGRQGPWHSFNDSNGGNIQPPLGTGFVATAGGANNTQYAVHTTGSGYQFGGVGFDLNNATQNPEAMQSMAYNASAFNGVTFWAKSSMGGALRVEFAMRSFVPVSRGGTCPDGGSCWNVYGANTPTLTNNWTQYTIMWAGMQREQGGTNPAFNPSELMSISFKGPGTFDFWVDEIAFTRAGGGPGTAGTTGAGGRGGTTGSAGTNGAAGRGGTTGMAGTNGTAGTTGTGGTSSIMHPPPITSGGMNGWGSRYWDCCKASCGWRTNAGGNPALSCGVSNMSVGENEQSACSGGGAYMCWNEAPWPLDDTLAYGFAAHNGVPCGRCYQIQFNGGGHDGQNNSSINGKTLIVQVTNIGGIASDQFDLLIPGGGVGGADPDSSSCKAQFGQNVDLGAQSGGFRTSCGNDKTCIMNKCQAAFSGKSDLITGCDWFVNWFGAADNPTFVFKQIACPSAITQRSGLRDPG